MFSLAAGRQAGRGGADNGPEGWGKGREERGAGAWPRPAGSRRLGAPGEPAAPLPTFMLAVPPSVQAEEVSPGRAGCPGRRGRRQEATGTTGN